MRLSTVNGLNAVNQQLFFSQPWLSGAAALEVQSPAPVPYSSDDHMNSHAT